MEEIGCDVEICLPGEGRGIQLFINDSEPSQKAVALMQKSSRIFRIFREGDDFQGCDFALPALFSLSGTFLGVDEIRAYVNSRLDLDAEPPNQAGGETA